MHGGLSPELTNLDQIQRVMRPTEVPDTGIDSISLIQRHQFINSRALGLLCDLLWSDPEKDVQGWAENERGVSYIFGPDVVTAFLKKHELDLICRAHQVFHSY